MNNPQRLIADALGAVSSLNREDVDTKLGVISHVRNVFGTSAVNAIMLGLSRRFRSTITEASTLMDEWERRDTTCCYSGSVDDFFSLKDTLVLAISYRHAPREQWSRKGSNRICKLSEEDEVLFKASVRGLGKNRYFPYLIVWCDQVLSTKLKFLETDFKWFHVGLLPYMTFQVLQMSTHIPEETLERRIWVRAERSLGRRSLGNLSGDDAMMGISGALGYNADCQSCITDVAKNILSGYWPEDLGYWADDYKALKQWALGVLCRGCKHLFRVDLFQDYDPVDNIEILLNFSDLARIPVGIEDKEPMLYTSDRSFFLKAVAWNLSVQTVWNEETQYLSHYMGEMKNTRFSWWRCDSSNMLFGCLACSAPPSATTVLAIERSNGYNVFRGKGDLTLYRDAENVVGAETKRLIRESGRKAGIDIDENLEWRLLYCSNDNEINTHTAKDIMNALGPRRLKSDVLVPPVFAGMTTKLFRCADAVNGGQKNEIARKICKCAEEWSKYVKSHYPEWIAIKDTSCGPVWLEGFDGERVSFGFLEFLTEALVLKDHCISANTCRMPKPEDVLKEWQSARSQMKAEEIMIAAELFRPNDKIGVAESLTPRDVLRFLLSGGFSKLFLAGGPRIFLGRVARARGYWTTQVLCRAGKMQIRFINTEEIRIAQRATELGDCFGFGIARPDDHDAVIKISQECDVGTRWGIIAFWQDMGDTTTREEMLNIFRSSMWIRDGKDVLLVDMTIGSKGEEDSALEAADVEWWFDELNKFERGQRQAADEYNTLKLSEAMKESEELAAQARELVEEGRQQDRIWYEQRLNLGMENEEGEEEERGLCGDENTRKVGLQVLWKRIRATQSWCRCFPGN